MAELLVDACVMINLAASGVPLAELASRNEASFQMSRVAAAEVLYVANDADELEVVELAAIVASGNIRLIELTEDEQSEFIAFARDLDDGEAATLAVASKRGWPVATDDRKARRLATRAGVHLVSTSALLRRWAGDKSEPRDRVAAVLQRVERRASFIPPKDDPLRTWWQDSRSQ